MQKAGKSSKVLTNMILDSDIDGTEDNVCQVGGQTFSYLPVDSNYLDYDLNSTSSESTVVDINTLKNQTGR